MSGDPFRGRSGNAAAPMIVLHRFTKPGGHVAEIRERNVTESRAIEFLVFVDGSLLESQMFHGGREVEYPAALGATITQFTGNGWTKEPNTRGPVG